MKRRRLKFSDYYNKIILNEVAEIYDVEKHRIFLGSRKKEFINAKRLYIFILREVFSLKFMDIARITNLHHASIIHHVKEFSFFYNNTGYKQDKRNFERVENRVIEVEIDEEIFELETRLKVIQIQLTKLYKINKQKNERQKRESLLAK